MQPGDQAQAYGSQRAGVPFPLPGPIILRPSHLSQTMSGSTTGRILQDAAAVSVGAVTGALLRHAVTEFQLRRGTKPWGIAAVNVFGSFILGGLTASSSCSPRTKLLLGTGLCGSFTTFSTFSVEMVGLIQGGETAKAATYFLVNNVGGVAAAGAGMLMFGGTSALCKRPQTPPPGVVAVLERLPGAGKFPPPSSAEVVVSSSSPSRGTLPIVSNTSSSGIRTDRSGTTIEGGCQELVNSTPTKHE